MHPHGPECLEGGRNIVRSSDFRWNDLEAEVGGRRPNLARLLHCAGKAGISHDRQPADIRKHLTQQFEALANKIGRLEG